MKSTAKLSSEDRNFFTKVVQTIFSNPFSDERTRIITSLVPTSTVASDTSRQDIMALAPLVNERLLNLRRKGLDTFQQFKENDRQTLKYIFLLRLYLKYFHLFDDLIEVQLACHETSVKVPFADEAFEDLKKSGITAEESLHYFAMYYQLRRAFYFIERALVGESPSMKKLRLSLWNNVFTLDIQTYNQHLYTRMQDFSTLLLGETGTGKGAAAAAIGQSGYIPFDRKTGRFVENFTQTFVAINLSQFSETLIESELFGHQKGAFTGAVEHHEGVLERCNKYGSLFIDEIGDVSVSIQIKLLKVLQERTFTSVGSHEEKHFLGRVIGATQHPIEMLREKGNFRDDFFYRLCSDMITAPPLRKRIQELPSELEQLINLLVSRLTGLESQDLTIMILETLKRDLPPEYTWPGNVRELEQAVRRILLTQHYNGDLTVKKPGPNKEFLQKIQEGSLEARELLSSYCNFLYQRFGNYEEVARRTKLDRRTVKKYLEIKKGA